MLIILNSSIWPIDWTLIGTTIPTQNGIGSNGNEGYSLQQAHIEDVHLGFLFHFFIYHFIPFLFFNFCCKIFYLNLDSDYSLAMSLILYTYPEENL